MPWSAAGRAPAVRPGPYPGDMYGVYAWLRGHPRLMDVVLAAALVAGSLGQLPSPSASSTLVTLAALAVSLLLAGAVVVRRRYPVAAFMVAGVIVAAQITLGVSPGGDLPPVRALEPTVTDLAIAVLLYTLAAYRPRRISLAGLGACLVGSAVAVARWAPVHAAGSTTGLLAAAAAGLGGTALTAWVLGDSMAYRRAYYMSLEDRAVRLEAERDAQARIAAAAERARELQERRALAVDESAARLRRIERDLHDGAQVRLAALAMALGEIKENLAQADTDPGTLKLVGSAHQNAKNTLTELRDLARGIHPPVLDRGLGEALTILAGTSAIPVALTVCIAERPSPAIEAIAYFCTAELLANAAKHSGARSIQVSVKDSESGPLALTVTDDGAGGARVAPRGGLAGLLERVQTVDGQLMVGSPPGGPTTVTIELPRHA